MANSVLGSGSLQDKTGRTWSDRLLWICPVVGLVAGGVILWLFGINLWTAVAFLFLIACPLVVIWLLVIIRRENRRTGENP